MLGYELWDLARTLVGGDINSFLWRHDDYDDDWIAYQRRRIEVGIYELLLRDTYYETLKALLLLKP